MTDSREADSGLIDPETGEDLSAPPPTEPTYHRPKGVRPTGAIGPVLTGQVLIGSWVDEVESLPLAEEPVKFPWEEPLPGGQGKSDETA